MRQCPRCHQSFTDDILYCLTDGTPLITEYDAPEEMTFVRSQQNVQPPIQTTKQGVSPIFAYLSIGLFLLLICIGIIALGIFVVSKMTSNNPQTANISTSNNQANNSNLSNLPIFQGNNEQSKLDEEKAKLREKQAEIEKEKQKLADERKKLGETKDKIIEPPTYSTPIPPPPPPKTYPPQPTARIKFSKGGVSSSVSGKVYSQRSFVLEARGGQYLSASVNGGSCVVFSNGGKSLGYVTRQGDNQITVVNNCSSEAGFSLSVSIR